MKSYFILFFACLYTTIPLWVWASEAWTKKVIFSEVNRLKLRNAIYNKNADAVQKYMLKGKDAQIDFDANLFFIYEPLLHFAIKNSTAEIVKIILPYIKNINLEAIRETGLGRPLTQAILKRDPAIVKLLLKQGAIPNLAINIANYKFQPGSGWPATKQVLADYHYLQSEQQHNAFKSGMKKMAQHHLMQGLQHTERKTSAESQQLSHQVAQYLYPKRMCMVKTKQLIVL